MIQHILVAHCLHQRAIIMVSPTECLDLRHHYPLIDHLLLIFPAALTTAVHPVGQSGAILRIAAASATRDTTLDSSRLIQAVQVR